MASSSIEDGGVLNTINDTSLSEITNQETKPQHKYQLFFIT